MIGPSVKMAMRSLGMSVIFVLVFATARSKSIEKRQATDTIDYLYKFGYYMKPKIGPSPGDIPPAISLDNSAVRRALIRFQEFAGLPQTGELDDATTEVMAQPRCAVPDVSDNGLLSKYQIGRTQKWRKRDMTYTINKYSSKISRAEVDNELKKAFTSWSGVTNLRFRKVDHSNADIRISFHGAAHNFEGPSDNGFTGSVLAHAWHPVDGRLHFDEQERWTSDPSMF